MQITIAGQNYEKNRFVATGEKKDAGCVITIDNPEGDLVKTFTGSASSHYSSLEKQQEEAINDTEKKFRE